MVCMDTLRKSAQVQLLRIGGDAVDDELSPGHAEGDGGN